MNDTLYSAIKELITTYDDGVNEYSKLYQGTKEDIDNKRLTPKVAQELREDLQNKVNNKLEQIKSNVNELLEESVKYQEKKAREHLASTLDANESGELMLLSTMDDLTHNDLQNYLEKYKDKPLALRKIQQIAKSKDIVLSLNEEQMRMVDPLGVINENKNRIEKLVDRNSFFHAGAAIGTELVMRNSFDYKKGDIEELGKIQKNTF